MSKKSNEEWWKDFCLTTINPGKVKRKSREIMLVDNWEIIKTDVMRECINQKFYQEPFSTLLLETKNQYIIEGNNWKDTFWGIDDTLGGLNILGNMIMKKRLELYRENKDKEN